MFEAKKGDCKLVKGRKREIYPIKYLNIPQEIEELNLSVFKIHDIGRKIIVLLLKVSCWINSIYSVCEFFGSLKKD